MSKAKYRIWTVNKKGRWEVFTLRDTFFGAVESYNLVNNWTTNSVRLTRVLPDGEEIIREHIKERHKNASHRV